MELCSSVFDEIAKFLLAFRNPGDVVGKIKLSPRSHYEVLCIYEAVELYP